MHNWVLICLFNIDLGVLYIKTTSRAIKELSPLSNKDDESCAIQVRGARLSYGKSTIVMRNLSMEVPRGTIYGLLGPSGCGKTSLIRCILGTLKLNSGYVSVFGARPGSSGSLVPGPGVGYMPQEITLRADLSIRETLYYFASLYGLSKRTDEFTQRCGFLVSFLNLPDPKRLIGQLSGGQKRRVSLAVTLIHKPPLLILDEPTVGVDPLLRKSIWNHLSKLSQEEHLTVLITTHYIEEARDAHLVGFMRDGQILVQDSPTQLLAQCEKPTLEEVFLELCSAQDSKKRRDPINDEDLQNVNYFKRKYSQMSLANGSPTPSPPWHLMNARPRTNVLGQIRAMSWKNFTTLLRSPGYLLFQFILPMIQAILFCSSMGRDLSAIPVSVYDGDQSNLTTSLVAELNQSSDVVRLQMHPTEEAALDSVRNGQTGVAVIILPGFEMCLFMRMTLGNVSAEIRHNSTIRLHPDLSNQLLVQFVQREVISVFRRVGKRLYAQRSQKYTFPVEMSAEPIYGEYNAPYTEFMAPGALLNIAYFAAISLTTMNIVVERIQGLIERTQVAGVPYYAILLSYLLTYTLVLMIQVIGLVGTILVVFGIPYRGPLVLIVALPLLHSMCGMCMGLFISSVSNHENTATMLSLAFFYPSLMLSGTIWPLESMNRCLIYASYLLPSALPIRAMRAMMLRGWGLERWDVALGFMVTSSWIIIFLCASIVALKCRKV